VQECAFAFSLFHDDHNHAGRNRVPGQATRAIVKHRRLILHTKMEDCNNRIKNSKFWSAKPAILIFFALNSGCNESR